MVLVLDFLSGLDSRSSGACLCLNCLPCCFHRWAIEELRMKVARRESAIQKEIISNLEARQILYVRINPIRLAGKQGRIFAVPIPKSQKGAPDLLVFPDDFPPLALEVKSEVGRQKPEQKLWEEKWVKCGNIYRVVRSWDEVSFFLANRFWEYETDGYQAQGA